MLAGGGGEQAAFEPLREATSSAFTFFTSFLWMVVALLFLRGFLPETR